MSRRQEPCQGARDRAVQQRSGRPAQEDGSEGMQGTVHERRQAGVNGPCVYEGAWLSCGPVARWFVRSAGHERAGLHSGLRAECHRHCDGPASGLLPADRTCSRSRGTE